MQADVKQRQSAKKNDIDTDTNRSIERQKDKYRDKIEIN